MVAVALKSKLYYPSLTFLYNAVDAVSFYHQQNIAAVKTTGVGMLNYNCSVIVAFNFLIRYI